VRYKNSILGFFWSLVNPLATVLVMTIVFKYVMGMRIANYSAYILAAYLPWTFFQFALLDASQTILVYMQVIRKIYFPRVLLPLAAVLANFIHFLLALGVLFVYLYGFVGTPLQWGLLWLPVAMLSQLLWVVGLAAIVACWNVFYEDVKYLVSVGLQLLFFLTPIIYFLGAVALHDAGSRGIPRGAVLGVSPTEPDGDAGDGVPQGYLAADYSCAGTYGVGASDSVPRHAAARVVAGTEPAAGAEHRAVGLSYFRKREWEFVERP
jgi:hypothetical protein